MARRLALVALGVVLGVGVLTVGDWWRSQLRTPTGPPPPPAAPTTPKPAAIVDDASADDAASRLRIDPLGTIWTPAPGDAAVLESAALRIDGRVEATRTRGFGLEVRIENEASIGLVGEIRSARLEAELEATGFDGTWSLALGLGDTDEIAVVHAPDGRLTLQVGTSASTLASADEPRPEGPFVLALSVLGRTVSGSVDGERIVEADLDSIASGPRIWGLKLDGQGTLRIRRLQASSLAE